MLIAPRGQGWQAIQDQPIIFPHALSPSDGSRMGMGPRLASQKFFSLGIFPGIVRGRWRDMPSQSPGEGLFAGGNNEAQQRCAECSYREKESQ